MVTKAGLRPCDKNSITPYPQKAFTISNHDLYAVTGRLNMDVIDSAGVYKLADSVALNFFEEQGYNMSTLQKAM